MLVYGASVEFIGAAQSLKLLCENNSIGKIFDNSSARGVFCIVTVRAIGRKSLPHNVFFRGEIAAPKFAAALESLKDICDITSLPKQFSEMCDVKGGEPKDGK